MFLRVRYRSHVQYVLLREIENSLDSPKKSTGQIVCRGRFAERRDATRRDAMPEVHILRTNTAAMTDLQIPAIAIALFHRAILKARRPECTSNHTSTVYALCPQPFRPPRLVPSSTFAAVIAPATPSLPRDILTFLPVVPCVLCSYLNSANVVANDTAKERLDVRRGVRLSRNFSETFSSVRFARLRCFQSDLVAFALFVFFMELFTHQSFQIIIDPI